MCGNAILVLRQLIDEVKATLRSQDRERVDRPDFATEMRSVKDVWMKEWTPKLNSDAMPITPCRAINDPMKAVDRKNSIVVHDSGSPRDQMMPLYETVSPRGFIGWGKSTQLGYSLGVAMGAKMAEPDKLAIAVIGDYGFGMVGMDIETAPRESIPILTIVLNNSTMGIYTADRFPTAHELYGTKSTGGDFVKMAESMGCYSERVDQPGESIAAVQRSAGAARSGQPALLEIVTDGAVQEMSFRGF